MYYKDEGNHVTQREACDSTLCKCNTRAHIHTSVHMPRLGYAPTAGDPKVHFEKSRVSCGNQIGFRKVSLAQGLETPFVEPFVMYI